KKFVKEWLTRKLHSTKSGDGGYHMPLSPERKGKLTASRVACLMQGDIEEINNLYLEMRGEKQEKQLSDFPKSTQFKLRLGELTEPLALDWYEQEIGPVNQRGCFKVML